jgi:hypothetical protein
MTASIGAEQSMRQEASQGTAITAVNLPVRT